MGIKTSASQCWLSFLFLLSFVNTAHSLHIVMNGNELIKEILIKEITF